MGRLFIEKENVIQLDKEQYDLWRSDDFSGKTVCHAPFVSLDVRESGAVHACPYSEMDLGHVGGQPLESIWNGPGFGEVRHRFREYRVKVDECGGCVNSWKEGVPGKSPALVEFDSIKPARWGSPYVPQILRLDLRAPLSAMDTKTVFRWLPRLARLDLGISWPLPTDSLFRTLIDRAATLPDGKRPKITLQVFENIPEANNIPHGIAVVRLNLAMNDEDLSSHQGEVLEELARSLQARGAELVLEVSVHQGNWIHLRSWLLRAHTLGITLVPLLAPTSENASLATLDGDALACLHSIFEQWLSEHPHATQLGSASPTRHAMLDQLRRWQHEAAGRPPQRTVLSFPGPDHSIVQDETALEPFLAGLLRIYSDFSIERWLMGLTESKGFVAKARRRRSFRLAAWWLGCVFDRAEVLPLLGRVFRTHEEARRLIDKDRNALAGTIWESWFDGWTRQLYLNSLQPRGRRFDVGAPRRETAEETAQITVIMASYNHQAFIGKAIRSVLAQTRTDFRLLIVDDASVDETVKQAEKIQDPRILIRRNSKNLRHGPNLARALENVETEYVAFMDADDLFHPKRLEHCLSALEETPRGALVATGLAVVDKEGRFCSTADSSPVFEGLKNYNWLRFYEEQARLTKTPADFLGNLLEGNSLITTSNLVARTEFLRRHQSQWQRLEFCVDWQLFLAAALENRLCYVPETLLGYRLHPSNFKWTHCFDKGSNWHYYLEYNQVVARTLGHLLQRSDGSDAKGFTTVLSALTDHLNSNTSMDWPGVVLGFLLERLGLSPRDLKSDSVADRVQALIQARDFRLQTRFWPPDYVDDIAEQYRMRGEAPFLRSLRNKYEGLQNSHDRLQGEVTGLLFDRANAKKWWRKAEQERDQALAIQQDLQHQLGGLQGEHDQALTKQQGLSCQIGELQGEIEKVRASWKCVENERDQAIHDKGELFQEIGLSKKKLDCVHTQLEERTTERNALLHSLEYRGGQLLIQGFHCRPLIRGVEWMTVKIQRHLAFLGLTLARWSSGWRQESSRVLATVCAAFPIYSQTFVHQELSQLAKRGFQIRLIYSSLQSRGNLHHQFDSLWKHKSRLSIYDKIHEQDFDRFRNQFPEKVERLIHMVGDSSGVTREKLIRHPHFLQAFSFTRMAEVYRPHYLHSYFFYDRSFMALVAGYILDIPRGISCYADHVLDDYKLKVVPLHLELCDTVIATSERIKAELLAMAPKTDPTRIVVKPNAIDTTWFPRIECREPQTDEPFRLVCVNRIEPKKGLLYLVEAIHSLRQRGHHVELHVIGTADTGIQSSQDYKHKLDECISDYNLWGVVHLEGQQNQEGVLRFLNMSQVFIAPFIETDYGDKDGIPTALLEAMATGLPVVATDAGSMGEVIQHDREGDVVPQRDSQALADSIARLLTDPQRRKKLGQAAADTVRQRFDVSVCEHRFHDRVLSVIESRGPNGMSRQSPGFDFLPRWISRVS